MTKKNFEALAHDIAHTRAMVLAGDLPTPISVLKALAFCIGATCSSFNNEFDWYKWNTTIFGKEPENVSDKGK